MISNGDIENIIDPRLKHDYDANSVWKAVEVSLNCVSSHSYKRPQMSQVVIKLSESLAMEQVALKGHRQVTDSANPIEAFSMNTVSELGPSAR